MIAWWQLETAANAVISLSYFGITALILVPTIRVRQVRSNKLATATAAIFFSCAVGHGMHALHPLLVLAGGSAHEIAAAHVTSWWQTGWHSLTALVAVYYLTLRKSYGRLLDSAPLFDDLNERQRVAEMEERQTLSAARAVAEAERDSYAAMLKSIIQNSQAAVYVKDLEGRFLMANPELEKAFGRSEAELLGETDDIVDPVLGPLWRANDRRARDGSYRLSEWTDAPDGRHFFDSVKFPLFDAAGDLYATCSMSIEVTEQRRAAEAVAEARDAAIAATAAKSTFLATMSHEIRTPMNAVIGMTDLLMDTDLTAQQHEFVETVRASGDALIAVINDILDFSKIESGELLLEAEPFDLREEIEGCLDLVAVAATSKGLDLVSHVDDSCPQRVVGDVVRLRQILTNLLSNAVKFTEHKDVLVTVSGAPAGGAWPLTVAPSEPDLPPVALTISVTDTGIGIPAAGVERLFKSFSQVDASTTRVYGGTGLGLAISQRLAEAMGGGITVSSTPGVGSTFAATIVLDRSSEVVSKVAASATSAVLAGKSALLVDDNATNLRILDLQLTGLGMRCTTAATPSAALGLVADGLRYDVAAVDMRMPEMSGVELCDALRRSPGNENAPIVLLTSVGWRPQGAQRSYAAFLNKPVKSAALRDVLAAVISGQVHMSQPQPERPATFAPASVALRVLLAEDNAVNQRVAELMLEKLGHRVDIVSNGREALDAAQATAYDVVLMDVQMPLMDGLEATRRIRADVPATRQPHIIAMTASALVEDREACAAAGMESYLTKPVRAHELQEVLARASKAAPRRPLAADATEDDTSSIQTELRPTTVLQPSPGEVAPPMKTSPPIRSSPQRGATPAKAPALTIDEDRLDELMRQIGDADGSMREELILTYLEESGAQVSSLLAAAAAGDRATIASVGHSLRSTSELLGACLLRDLLEQLEDIARGESGPLSPLASMVAAEHARFEAALVRLVSPARAALPGHATSAASA